jgi:hypothetical protein
MTKEDISRVGEILYEGFSAVAAEHGYTSNINNVEEGRRLSWALFHHGPSERLVAESENRVIGSTCLNLRGDFAGLGPTVVDPYSKNKTIGRELIRAVLEKAEPSQGSRTIVEAFNPAIFSLCYFALNYMPVADLLDVYLDGEVQQTWNLSSHVSQMTAKDIDEVYTYDNPRSKLDRRPDLKFYVNWGKVFVYHDQSRIRGFLACLPGPRWVQLGPLVAEGEEQAECLFRHALAVFKNRRFRSRVMARDYTFVKSLKGFGFRIYCIDMLLVRGPWRPSQCIEAFGIFPEAV